MAVDAFVEKKKSEVDVLLKINQNFLGTRERILKNDILEVLRYSVLLKPNSSFRGKMNFKSNTNETEAAREALRDDPYNMMRICKLGFQYAAEARYSSAMAVLLRGWKRVGELPDTRLRTKFLLLLAETSYREGKHRQAWAVIQDIETPSDSECDSEQLMSFYMLSALIAASNGEVEKALKSFNSAIKDEDIPLAVRLWAYVAVSFGVAGIYDAGRSLVDAVVTEKFVRLPQHPEDYSPCKYDLISIEDMVMHMPASDKSKAVVRYQGYALIGCGAMVSLLFLYFFLHSLEQWNLSRFHWPGTLK